MEFVLKDAAARSKLCAPPAFVEFLLSECSQPIHARFERQVLRCPNAPAVRLLSGDISYEELNNDANRAARVLLAKAATDAGPIALMLNQGYESIFWTLAILKAGLCYAPLDQRLPESVLRSIIENLAPGALIAGSGFQHACGNLAAGRIPIISADMSLDGYASENLNLPITADRVACVFYTSGSTGLPKGVANSHQNILHNIMRYTNSLKFAAGDIMSLVQPPRFSGTVSSLFGALLNGATSAPFDQQTEGSFSISQWVQLARVTVFHAVPSIFRQLFDPVARFPGVRLIRLEGDRASALDVRHFRENFQDDCTLVNGLGATECGLVRQFFLDKQTALDVTDPLPIGFPVPDMGVRIVDDLGRDLPPESSGEIVVESSYLATGYWRSPELTEARFIALQGGVRRYRTGDLGRMTKDGCLTHLGRVDHQIRIAGEFIVAADIEKVLLAIPGISQAIVRDFVNPVGERRLCAYLVSHVKAETTVSRLRAQLSERISSQLVPSAFIFLDELPMTEDFKIDYERLPPPDRQRPNLANDYVAARTEAEQKLVKIWQNVFGIQSIGIHDNFFDLGGSSLLAVRIFTEIEKTVGKLPPIASIFQTPTVEQFASILNQEELSASRFSLWSSHPSAIVPFQPRGSKPPLFWFNWGFWDFRLPRYLGSSQPVYGLQHQGQDGHRVRSKSIEEMAMHYIEEIRSVQSSGPYFLGGYCIGGMVTYEMTQQLQKQGEEVALLVLLDPDPVNVVPGQASGGRKYLSSLFSQGSWYRDKICRHFRELQALRPGEKLGYFRVRITNRMTALSEKISWSGKRILCESFGWSLPPSLRTHYIAAIYGKAAREYLPKPYRGEVILFKTKGRYNEGQLGWENVILEGLEVQELDCDHESAFKEPYVRIFAEKLRVHLSRAQRNTTERRHLTVGSSS